MDFKSEFLSRTEDRAIGCSGKCILSRIILLIASIILLLGLLVWIFQEKLLFFPNINGKRDLASNFPGYRHPNERKMNSEDVVLTTDDNVKLYCWFIIHKKFDRYFHVQSSTMNINSNLTEPHHSERVKKDDPGKKIIDRKRKAPKYMKFHFPKFSDRYEQQEKAPTIIFFHGNAGNIGHRLPRFLEFYNLIGVNIFAVSYRGYGDSEGTPSEEGFYLDAKASLEYVLSRTDVVDKNMIFLYGHSIGGAVAIDLASKYNVTGVILENTFTNIKSVAFRVYPIFKYFGFFFKFIQRLKFDSISKISRVKSPILFVVGNEDEIIRPTHSVQLFMKAGSPKSLNKIYLVSGGSHNNTWIKGGMEFYLMLLQFIYNAIDYNKPELEASSNNSINKNQQETLSSIREILRTE
ncbi:Alpha/beta hydrolase family protein [Cryptosporidium meleagridis]|uniref:Alpha/beta hydrolase family protein n=1 Tax=Cryptosporidium meleagridis TaxID=93969 RepID=A0A2P4YXC4_9CRYT|nr:Alpha/beta hydrolase family protein [Cryptosporidium meleagridis]